MQWSKPARWILTSLLGLVAPVLSEPAAAAADLNIMPLEDVRPGMTGEGLSAFSQEGLERFDVEVIDVLRNTGPHRDMILARLGGAVVEKAGIIAGMSGSPVYIEGRLVGAVAYGWTFSKEPIAGITPIAEMLELMSLPEPPEPLPAVPEAHTPIPMAPTPGSLLGTGLREGAFERIRVPVVVSGFAPDAVAQISERFAPLGLEVLQGAGERTGGEGVIREIRAGDPVSIPLVRGDASVAAFGTVTYADGDRLVAFGHPVFHMAGERLPLAGGRVIGVLPSLYHSFRFTSATEPVGFFYADRWSGVAGRIGDPPPMLPVEIHLDSADGAKQYRYEIVRDRFLTPALLQDVVFNSVVSGLYRAGLGTLSTDLQVHLETGTVIRHRDMMATLNAPEILAQQVASPVAALLNNPHVVPRISRVEIQGRVDGEVRIASIDRVELLDRPVRPGDRIRVKVTLRPYRGGLRDRLLTLEIPSSAPTGEAILKVCDAHSLAEWDRERAPDKYVPRDYAQFLERLRDLPAHNVLVAKLYVEGAALVIGGREFRELPPSVASALGDVQVAGGRSVAEGIEVTSAMAELEEHVVGCQTLSVELEER